MVDSRSESSPLYLTIRLSDRDAIRLLATITRNEGYDFEIIAIADPRDSETDAVVIDLSSLTEKQREALKIAHDIGHYSGPRGGNLEIIADELNISKSAASQRLRSAEARIIQAILGPEERSSVSLSLPAHGTEGAPDTAEPG